MPAKIKKYELLGQRIKSRMIEKGLQHKDLVNNINVSKGAVTHWLDGTSAPTGERLEKLCELLEIDKIELKEGKFDESNTKDSLLLNTKHIDSLHSVRVPLFRKALDCFNYISNSNEFNNMSLENNAIEHPLETTEIPISVLKSISVEPDNIVILKKASKDLGVYESAQIDLFLDHSVKVAATNGTYFIEFGELKDTRQLSIHPVTGVISIIDIAGRGSDDKTPITDFDFELKIHAKAVYVGIALN